MLYKIIGFNRHIWGHCLAVNRVAVSIANELLKRNIEVNIRLVDAGSLLHDIGRFKVHDISHGVVGGELIRKLGYDERLARIAEAHVLGGFTVEEAEELGLPPKDYLPRTLEEKICCYADKRCINDKIASIKERFEAWQKRYGKTPMFKKAYDRVIKIEKEILKR